LAHQAAGVRRAVGARHHAGSAGDRGRVESGVGAAGGGEPPDRASELTLVIISRPQSFRSKVIGGIGGDAGREARSQVHLLVDPGALEGEDVVLADMLILEVLGDVIEAIVGPLQRSVGTEGTTGMQLEIGAAYADFQFVCAPVVFIACAPVRRASLDDVGGGAVQWSCGAG